MIATSNGHGGARPNSGPPKGPYVKSQDQKDLDAAKARLESIKADRQELAHAVDLGKYVSRDAMRQAVATTIAAFSQSVRSIPDALERQLGLEPRVVEAVGTMLDAALNDLADQLVLLGGKE